ncbi:LOW QUALITY PROTEIN: hypothetical protein PanWU01x14_266000 [Parasponia andersonii]|uniref:Uncharacterized protein n=1 Tax=Parasponia andersonii TaxID=3476 RepID=A0A2P5B6T8_PARAD|nr:LOW QUALITY PROTEIN: hypothetical protein PanWU01x14_266000 [Parasponia andersonii]
MLLRSLDWTPQILLLMLRVSCPRPSEMVQLMLLLTMQMDGCRTKPEISTLQMGLKLRLTQGLLFALCLNLHNEAGGRDNNRSKSLLNI